MPDRYVKLPLVTMVSPKIVIWEKLGESPKAPILGDFDIWESWNVLYGINLQIIVLYKSKICCFSKAPGIDKS